MGRRTISKAMLEKLGFKSFAEAERRRCIPLALPAETGRKSFSLPSFRRLHGKRARAALALAAAAAKEGKQFDAICADAAKALGTQPNKLLFLFRFPKECGEGNLVHLACRENAKFRKEFASRGLGRFDFSMGQRGLSAEEMAQIAPALREYFKYVVDIGAGAVHLNRLHALDSVSLPWKRLPFRIAAGRQELIGALKRRMGPLKGEPQMHSEGRFVPLPEGWMPAFASPFVLFKAETVSNGRLLAVFSPLYGKVIGCVRPGRNAGWLLSKYADYERFYEGQDERKLPLAGREDAPVLLDRALDSVCPAARIIEGRLNLVFGDVFRIKAASMYWFAMDNEQPSSNETIMGRVFNGSDGDAGDFFGLDGGTRLILLNDEARDDETELLDTMLHECAHLLVQWQDAEEDESHGPVFWKSLAAIACAARMSGLFGDGGQTGLGLAMLAMAGVDGIEGLKPVSADVALTVQRLARLFKSGFPAGEFVLLD